MRIYKPEVFQGRHRGRRYFEGWYNKLVSRTGDVFAVINGVASGAARDHAFIQVINGKTGDTVYWSFPYSSFHAARSEFDVRIGANIINKKSIHLDIYQDGHSMHADLRLTETTPLETTLSSPGIMGWYSFAPFMECKHGVVSLHHRLDGRFELDGQQVNYDGGNSYTEKDWGRSFPTAWVWMQANNFPPQRASFMFSVARIPWLGNYFIGFLCVLYTGDREYRFATYTGAQITKLEVHGKEVSIDVAGKDYSLQIEARRSRAGVLRAPVNGVMERRISESIDAVVDISLRNSRGEKLWNETGKYAGLEIVGDYGILRSGLKLPADQSG